MTGEIKRNETADTKSAMAVKEEKGYITIEDFHKVEARIGKVLSAERVEGSEKLLKVMLDFGEENPRQILSGIAKWYPNPQVLVGKQLLYCTNLAPRTMMGLESEGMLMAIDGIDGKPVFLIPDGEVPPGAKVH
jgi:methionyl-tRNA synthetase